MVGLVSKVVNTYLFDKLNNKLSYVLRCEPVIVTHKVVDLALFLLIQLTNALKHLSELVKDRAFIRLLLLSLRCILNRLILL